MRGQWSNLTHLHGVHCDVYTAIQKRLIDLPGEEALAADVGEGRIENLIACRLDDDNLERSLLTQLGESRL